MRFKINSITITISRNTITHIINVCLHNRHKYLTITILILSLQFKHRPTSILPLNPGTHAHTNIHTPPHSHTHTHTQQFHIHYHLFPSPSKHRSWQNRKRGRESLTQRDKHKCTLQTLQIQQAKVNHTPRHTGRQTQYLQPMAIISWRHGLSTVAG